MTRILKALLTRSGTTIPNTVLCENCFTTPGERIFSSEIARRSGEWNGAAFTVTRTDKECSACGYLVPDPYLTSSDHDPEPRGFTYKAANYCPEHIIEECLHTGLASPAARDMGVMEALAQIANANGVDFNCHATYDSDDFPKPFSRYNDEASSCAECGAVL